MFRSRSAWIGVATVAAAVALWFLLTVVTQWVSPARFPTPGEVWNALKQITVQGYADAHAAGSTCCTAAAGG